MRFIFSDTLVLCSGLGSRGGDWKKSEGGGRGTVTAWGEKGRGSEEDFKVVRVTGGGNLENKRSDDLCGFQCEHISTFLQKGCPRFKDYTNESYRLIQDCSLLLGIEGDGMNECILTSQYSF